MPFAMSPDRILITDVDGAIVLDTLRRMFLVTDRLNGSITLPYRETVGNSGNPAGTQFEQNNSYYLGACSTFASVVFGMFQLSFPGASNPAGVSQFAWYTLGGTYMHFIEATALSGDFVVRGPPVLITSGASAGQVSGSITHQVGCTFAARGGGVYLDEQCFMPRLPTSAIYGGAFVALRDYTLDYRLLVGAFDA